MNGQQNHENRYAFSARLRDDIALLLPGHREPDVIVSMSGETWARLYLSQAPPEELIASGDLEVTGDAAEASRLINLFDRYSPEKALVVPPAALDHM